jgi:replicative DNA helicase
MNPLPHDDEAEAAVLGGLLVAPELLPDVAAVLDPDDLYRDVNRAIYSAVIALDAQGITPDVVAVSGLLRFQNGSVAPMAIRDLAAGVAVPTAAPQHARHVAALATHRRLVIRLNEGLNASMSADADPGLIGAQVSADVLDLTARHEADARMIGELVSTGLDELEHPERRGAIPTGFRGLDHVLGGGLTPGQLVLVAARPGVGKTSFVSAIARNAAVRVPVAFFSLEMSEAEIALRLVCAEAGVSYITVHSGRASMDEWARLMETGEVFSKMPLAIIDRPTVKLPEVRAIARRTRGLGMVAVDYLQLMPSARSRSNRQEEVAEISRGLKLLAKELRVPIVACCQLNREAERRQDKRPQLSDLRESGQLEQDSDVVLLLHRDDANPSHAEVIVAKQRNGPTDRVRITFQHEQPRFIDSRWT